MEIDLLDQTSQTNVLVLVQIYISLFTSSITVFYLFNYASLFHVVLLQNKFEYFHSTSWNFIALLYNVLTNHFILFQNTFTNTIKDQVSENSTLRNEGLEVNEGDMERNTAQMEKMM